jgi:hypothetical protein
VIDIKNLPSQSVLKQQSTEDLKDLRDRLEEEIQRIKSQIGEARSRVHVDGEYSDAEWYSKAMAASRIMTQRFNVVLRVLGERRRADGQAVNARKMALDVDQVAIKRLKFIRVAERVLKPETFAAIWAEVNAEVEQEMEVTL